MALLTLTGICAPGVLVSVDCSMMRSPQAVACASDKFVYSRLVQNIGQPGGNRANRRVGRDRVIGGITIDGHVKLVARGRRNVGQGLQPRAVEEQIHLLNGPVRRAGGALKREIGDAAQHAVGRQIDPRAGRRPGERRGQRLAHDQALIRIGEAQVITFRQTETARLIEIILRRGEFLEVIARLGHRAVTAAGAGVHEGQQARFGRCVHKVTPHTMSGCRRLRPAQTCLTGVLNSAKPVW